MPLKEIRPREREQTPAKQLERVRVKIEAKPEFKLSEFFKNEKMAREIEKLLKSGKRAAFQVRGGRYSIFLGDSRIIIRKNRPDQFEPEMVAISLDSKMEIASMDAYAGGKAYPPTDLEIFDFFAPAKNIIDVGSLQKFSISADELRLAERGRKRRLEMAKKIKKSKESPSAFFPPQPSSMKSEKVEVVLQGQCKIMDNASSKKTSLYSEYAYNCAILIVKAINPFSKKVHKVAMAHIGPRATSQEIGRIYDALSSGADKTETYIIGPRADLALKICVVALEKRSELEFVSADFSSLVGDAAMVNNIGEIYYGNIKSISSPGLAVEQDRKRTRSGGYGLNIVEIK